jgi:2-polyprenyl-3-methyl-5-hydroxy-6-metoxy-1,4-benzoquinol methylase
MKIYPCGLCHGLDFEFAFEQRDRFEQDIRLVVCRGCGLSQLNPRRDVEEEEAFYASDYYRLDLLRDRYDRPDWSERKAKIASGILDAAEAQRPLSEATLLDVGAGRGFLLRDARERGAKVAGVEPSEETAELLREDGFDIFTGNLQRFAAEAPRSFDVITLSHVTEHVNQPIPFLQAAASLLKPGGLLVAEVPNVGQQLEKGRHPRSAQTAHLYYHTERSLAALFEVSGLRVQGISFGLGTKMVRAVGTPGPPRKLEDLPLDDPDEILAATRAAIRRLRRKQFKLAFRNAKKRLLGGFGGK